MGQQVESVPANTVSDALTTQLTEQSWSSYKIESVSCEILHFGNIVRNAVLQTQIKGLKTQICILAQGGKVLHRRFADALIPSYKRRKPSVRLLGGATSTGLWNSVFLALMSAPKSSSSFTTSVQSFSAAACKGESRDFPFCTFAPACITVVKQ